jgi:hypothetical protein
VCQDAACLRSGEGSFPTLQSFPVFNCFGDGPPIFVVVGAEHGLEASPVVLFLDKRVRPRSRRCDAGLLRTQRSCDSVSAAHEGRAAAGRHQLDQTVQVQGGRRMEPSREEAECGRGGFRGTGPGHEKASETHRIRVRMLFSVYEAARAIAAPSFACHGFCQAGLVAWDVARSMLSPYIRAGALPFPARFGVALPGSHSRRSGHDGPALRLDSAHGALPPDAVQEMLREGVVVRPKRGRPPSGSRGVRLD